MGQLRLMDDKKLYLCENNTCFEVLNGDDFEVDTKLNIKIGSYGKKYSTKQKFTEAVIHNFGIMKKQIVWLKPSQIPRIESKCCECKETKSFQKFDVEHYVENNICNRCLLKKFTQEYFEEHFEKGHQKDFIEEMKRQDKGRTLI